MHKHRKANREHRKATGCTSKETLNTRMLGIYFDMTQLILTPWSSNKTDTCTSEWENREL